MRLPARSVRTPHHAPLPRCWVYASQDDISTDPPPTLPAKGLQSSGCEPRRQWIAGGRCRAAKQILQSLCHWPRRHTPGVHRNAPPRTGIAVGESHAQAPAPQAARGAPRQEPCLLVPHRRTVPRRHMARAGWSRTRPGLTAVPEAAVTMPIRSRGPHSPPGFHRLAPISGTSACGGRRPESFWRCLWYSRSRSTGTLHAVRSSSIKRCARDGTVNEARPLRCRESHQVAVTIISASPRLECKRHGRPRYD